MFVSVTLADVIVYVQPPNFGGTLYASQNDTNPGGNGNFATVYDNFTIYSVTKPYRIDDVEWFGGYFNGAGSSITGWTVSFYADNANAPGTLLWSRNFPIIFKGYMESCGYPNGMCAYDIDDFTNGFVAWPNTQYWLSVVPDIGFPPQWGWDTGFLGDGLSYQTFFGATGPLNADFAMNLQGTPVPEPVSIFLLGGGLLGVVAKMRSKLDR
jgi:hypothetical protein